MRHGVKKKKNMECKCDEVVMEKNGRERGSEISQGE